MDPDGVGGLINDRRVTSGVGGVICAILGMMLVVGASGGLFLLGLFLLLAGVSLLVRLLLQLTETGLKGGGSGGSGLNLEGIAKMPAMSQWVAGAVMGVLSLFGLFLYSRAADGMFATFGGLLFLFGLAVIIVLVHKATDYSSTDTVDEAAGRPAQS